jgi:hypothetical protein
MNMKTDTIWVMAMKVKIAAEEETDLKEAGKLTLQAVKWFDRWSESINKK